MKKKIMAVLLACTLAVGLAVSPAETMTVQAEEEQKVTEDGLVCDDQDYRGIEITGYTGNASEVVIPESIDGKKVYLIYTHAFSGCKNITSIRIPDSVTQISNEAFRGCSSLTSIDIPDGVQNIGERAFWECSSLANVRIPDSVAAMGAKVFSGTPWLAEQFEQNEGLAIANHILVDVDENISGNIAVPAGVTLIAGGVFCRNSNLTGLSIPDGITYIDDEAFSGCSSLSSISLSTSLKEISASAFSGCSSLTSSHIPSGVTQISGGAFENCSSLTNINIPSSVTYIDSSAFAGCSSLKDVYYDGSQEQWSKIEIVDRNNESLFSATIHYNSSGPDAGTVTKSAQSVMASDITKTYGAKTFSLGAKSSGGTALSYLVSDPKVAAVDANGNVTIKGCGITDITITAAETSTYEMAQKIIKLTVKPKTMAVSSVKSKKKKTATVKWKKDKSATGYMIECATDKKFKKNKVTVTVSKYKTVSTTVKKLKAGKKYYVRICAYAKSGSTKVQGDWSKAKTVKVKN